MEVYEPPISRGALRAAALVLMEIAESPPLHGDLSLAGKRGISAIDKGARELLSPDLVDEQLSLKALAEVAQSLYDRRRKRDQEFGNAISNEPVWDMLLDLFVARVNGRGICVTSMCIASCAPQATAMRYIDFMETEGLIRKMSDPLDKRRTMVDLSHAGFKKMVSFLKDEFAKSWSSAGRTLW